MNFLLILLLPLLSHASQEMTDAKKSLESLIRPLLGKGTAKRPPGTEKFRIDQCERKEIDWMSVLMMKERVTLDYKFKPGCDIQGSIAPKVFLPFEAELAIRNIQSYDRIKATNRITANLDTKPILNLELKEGLLSGKHRVIFEADYQIQINPTNKAQPIEKNLGGTLRILEINGKKVNVTEKIMVK